MTTLFHSGSALANADVAQNAWWAYLVWIAAAALLGLAIAAIFADRLRLARNLYLIPYVILVSAFLYAFVIWSGVSLTELLINNWAWGVIGAILFGAFVVRNVMSQPASARPVGPALVLDILWSGVVL